MSTQGQSEALVERYVKLRDAKAKIAKKAKDQCDALDEAMTRIEAVLLSKLNEQGENSVSTAAGTAYKDPKTFTSVQDWDAFLGYIRENDLWHMLKRDCAKNAIVEFKEANDDQLPPGIGWREEITIKVRRA